MVIILMPVFGNFRSYFAGYTRQGLEPPGYVHEAHPGYTSKAIGPSYPGPEIHLRAFRRIGNPISGHP